MGGTLETDWGDTEPEVVAAPTPGSAASSPSSNWDAHLEVGEDGSPGLLPGDEFLSRDSFLRMEAGDEAEARLSPGAAPSICPRPPAAPKTHALRRLVRLMRLRTRGELGQDAAGGSMTRETR